MSHEAIIRIEQGRAVGVTAADAEAMAEMEGGTYRAVMTDRKAALVHYITTQPESVTAYLQGLADADVRQGKRQIPGFDVVEGTAL